MENSPLCEDRGMSGGLYCSFRVSCGARFRSCSPHRNCIVFYFQQFGAEMRVFTLGATVTSGVVVWNFTLSSVFAFLLAISAKTFLILE